MKKLFISFIISDKENSFEIKALKNNKAINWYCPIKNNQELDDVCIDLEFIFKEFRESLKK